MTALVLGLVTASVYALSFLPALLGSMLLGPLADRLPRRALLAAGDLARAALLAAMALLNLPFAVLAVMFAMAALLGGNVESGRVRAGRRHPLE